VSIRRPFLSYYGGKFRAAHHYPPPSCPRLIEPFAGSAGYACRYPHLSVTLYDIDPIICGVWEYLIRSSRLDILSLPLLPLVGHVDDLPSHVCQEAKWLIGFWLGRGTWYPRDQHSAWGKTGDYEGHFWSVKTRAAIAEQVQYIQHWRVSNRSYTEVANRTATWFVDPPYSSSAGRRYTFNQIEYSHLASWCQTRQGQVLVCEHNGADWLPFEHLVSIQSAKGKRRHQLQSHESVWENRS
jgi:site-specific DNA-adenine methylase